MIQPSCPAFVIHDDDAFRRELIKTLDTNHFAVTFAPDGDGAIDILRERKFSVIVVGVNLTTGAGVKSVDYLRDHRESIGCGVIILGDPDPRIRTCAPWADETLLKPADPAHVATRARTYCGC